MERFTERHFRREDHYMKCSGTCANDSMCGGCPYLDKLVQRLAAYEDTGLEPEEITALQEERRWIPVTERLPEKDGIYLTYNKKKEYEFHLFQAGKRMWQAIWKEDGVTHWMSLPQLPKEDT